jgi:hypothetical protein
LGPPIFTSGIFVWGACLEFPPKKTPDSEKKGGLFSREKYIARAGKRSKKGTESKNLPPPPPKKNADINAINGGTGQKKSLSL